MFYVDRTRCTADTWSDGAWARGRRSIGAWPGARATAELAQNVEYGTYVKCLGRRAEEEASVTDPFVSRSSSKLTLVITVVNNISIHNINNEGR